jgi:cytochrome c oxidase cbb3-type subunit III
MCSVGGQALGLRRAPSPPGSTYESPEGGPGGRRRPGACPPLLAVVLLWVAALPLLAQPGPSARPKPDSAGADRGKRLYLQYCINCHGTLAQGTEEGPDLIRSVAVLRDRGGNELGPALKRLSGHKTDFAAEDVNDLMQFLKQRVEYTAQNRNAAKPPNVLTGNPDTGRTWFIGAGGCTACHSISSDFAGIGRRYDPVTIQQRFLFPRTRPIAVKVTPPGITGTLDRIDDFSVSLRDAAGEHRNFERSLGIDVKLDDPLSWHHELLDRITDAEIHNVVTYLETLK